MKEIIKKLGLESGFKEMLTLYKRIPRGTIVPSNALMLYALCWHMKYKLGDMVTTAERHEENIKNKRDNMQLDIESESTEKSVAAKERFAKGDERWRNLQKQRVEAEVLRKYLDRKRTDFEQAMYMMKMYIEHATKDEKSMPNEEIT